MASSSRTAALVWKIVLIVVASIGLLTCLIPHPGFWSGYVLDIVGPAWGYILLRGNYSHHHSSFLSLKFTPETAALSVLGICYAVETSQYFRLYDAHFDPYDYLAYISLLLPCYMADKVFTRYFIAKKIIK